ncbi:RES family NAD+ phosphorylase [Caballeronia sp. 15715]|uniref:RES family NAD+ phosphorylase n=1 Tax=unclassified Caballeronia TaxID=2646786 RepID=UPI0039E71093
MSLKQPDVAFSALVLPVIEVDAAKLVRISRHNSGEPYFGKSGLNRFDDPRGHLPRADRYGTCYFGFTLACGFAETVLHDRTSDGGRFKIPYTELDQWVIRFKGDKLKLAVLTGKHLKRLGGEGSLSSIVPYELPQQWSLAIHEHPATVDGFVYMSRHLNTEEAVVLFDRALGKLTAKSPYKEFQDYPGSLRVLREFNVLAY